MTGDLDLWIKSDTMPPSVAPAAVAATTMSGSVPGVAVGLLWMAHQSRI